MRLFAPFFFVSLSLMCGCATESHRKIEPPTVEAKAQPYAGPKVPVTLGSFANRSGYMQGLFSDGTDRLGAQARTILEAHLKDSARFTVLNRSELEQLGQEASYLGKEQSIQGARYTITGAVAEFGRKTTGDVQLFGIAGKGKTQVAYAKVTLNVVDVLSSEVAATASGAGEFALSNRQVVGFGGTAGYDATLNGKVLDLAIREAIDDLAKKVDLGLLITR
ncbi:MAG: CsgG/HfaB family protein [Opitutales bacterium]